MAQLGRDLEEVTNSLDALKAGASGTGREKVGTILRSNVFFCGKREWDGALNCAVCQAWLHIGPVVT